MAPSPQRAHWFVRLCRVVTRVLWSGAVSFNQLFRDCDIGCPLLAPSIRLRLFSYGLRLG
jgi:hypothetical protein